MASLDGADIKEGKVGANALAEGTGVSGLVVAAPAAAQLAHSVVEEIYNRVDANLLGINAAFDTENNVNLYRHIDEFYRIRGEGEKLYLLLAPQATSMADILDDVDVEFAKLLLNTAKGEVRQLAIAVNPTDATVMLNNMPDDVFASIPKAQGLYNWADERFKPAQIILECYDFGTDSAAAANLRAIENVKAPNVSLVNGQDWKYADSLVGNAQKFGDVGTALGTLSAAAINQNIGDNEAFNLTDSTKDAWLIPGLSSHKKNTEVAESLQTLENKGYIFGFEYVGMDGVRWNNDHTCVEIIVDDDGNINGHTIAYNRTHDEARRRLRTALLPKVKTKQPVNPKTGLLPIGVVKHFENLGDAVLDDMERRKEITEGKTIVDPKSDLLVEKLLKVKFQIIPYGNVNAINGTSNLKTSL